jgi:GTP-dependent dephospho-CoA kinase
MLVLPKEHRKLFKNPFGELHRDIDTVIPLLANRIIYTVGDVVTHNLQKRGIIPAIAVVDGQTMRLPCNPIPDLISKRVHVINPPGTLTDDLIHALEQAVNSTPVMIIVEGEEDLAVIPLVIAAPDGAVILYGQPHEGVVIRTVDAGAKAAARKLLNHFIQANA